MKANVQQHPYIFDPSNLFWVSCFWLVEGLVSLCRLSLVIFCPCEHLKSEKATSPEQVSSKGGGACCLYTSVPFSSPPCRAVVVPRAWATRRGGARGCSKVVQV